MKYALSQDSISMLAKLANMPQGMTMEEMRLTFDFAVDKRLRGLVSDGRVSFAGAASRMRRFCVPENIETALMEFERVRQESRTRRQKANNKVRWKKRKAAEARAAREPIPVLQKSIPASSVPPPVAGPSSVFAWAEGFAD